jgi:hypothetical protein
LDIRLETLPIHSQEVLNKLKSLIKKNRFVLAGGTGLALLIGHRISEDLEFFSDQDFSTDELFQQIKRKKLSPVILQEEKGTLTITANDVKVSFLHYAYPFKEKMNDLDGVPIAGMIDIASMKMIAISQRGAKRDFVDLFAVMQSVPFWKIAENMIERFGKDRVNAVHIGKSMVYFNDADIDPNPRYLGSKKPDWENVKKFFKKNAQQMVLDLDQASRG